LNTLSPCPAQRFDMPLQISNFKETTGAIIVVFRIKGEQSQLIDNCAQSNQGQPKEDRSSSKEDGNFLPGVLR